jgi:translation initiation factor 4G
MATDQPVISLRPGGGGIGLRGPRLFPTAFAAATGAGDFLRPHAGSSTGFAVKVIA